MNRDQKDPGSDNSGDKAGSQGDEHRPGAEEKTETPEREPGEQGEPGKENNRSENQENEPPRKDTGDENRRTIKAAKIQTMSPLSTQLATKRTLTIRRVKLRQLTILPRRRKNRLAKILVKELRMMIPQENRAARRSRLIQRNLAQRLKTNLANSRVPTSPVTIRSRRSRMRKPVIKRVTNPAQISL